MTEQSKASGASPPSRGAMIFLAVFYLIAIVLLVFSRGRMDFLIGCGFIAAGSVLIVPRFLWTVSVNADSIRIGFPLSPWLNRTFTADDISQFEVVKNPIRVFAYSDFIRLRFKASRQLALPRMGTRNPELLESHLQGIITKTKDGEQGGGTLRR